MQTLGKVLGGLGLLLLLSSPLTLMITSGSAWYAGIKALVGVGLIGIYLATNYNRLLNADGRVRKLGSQTGPRPMGQGRRASFFFLSSALLVGVAVAALGATNFIAVRRNKTWDLTSKKIYTLAPQTISTLQGLKTQVTALGFLPASHPYYEPLDQLFRRYHAESDRFVFELKDPKKNPDLAAKYQLKEGQATVVLTRGEGATESHSTLNVVSEQELTNALIKINAVGEQKLYYLVGHGEWPLDEVGGGAGDPSVTSAGEFKKSLLQEGYTPEVLNLAEKKNEIPRDAAAVIIAGAKSPFQEAEKAALKGYLDAGGRLLYFAEDRAEPGLDKLLAEYGVQVDKGLLADDKVSPTSPYVIISAFYGEHEVTRILSQLKLNVELPTARGLSLLHEGLASGVSATPVVLTSPYAWEETTPNDHPQASPGEKTGQIPVVAVSTRPTASAPQKRFDEARVVVFGDSELLVDALWGPEPDRNLVLNSLGWATNQVSKITIRPPDRDISTIDIDDPLMAKIRFIAMDMLPLSLLGVGLAIWLTRRSK